MWKQLRAVANNSKDNCLNCHQLISCSISIVVCAKLTKLVFCAAESSCGFNLIVVDPPWENGSARQKLRYGCFLG